MARKGAAPRIEVSAQTRNLTPLTAKEIKAGYEIVDCINCEQGRRRVKAACETCAGTGRIRVFNGKADV